MAMNNNIDHQDSKGKTLLRIARAAISQELGFQLEAEKDAPWLQDKAACFVTLTKNGELRGCIGTLEAHRSLLDDVTANAKAAAFKDTRFAPLSSEELDEIDIEVSLLSTMKSIEFTSEQDALEQLRPDIDGVVFESGVNRSTFLPQVWQQLPDVKDFISHLKQKAGLSGSYWADDVKLSHYTVTKWKEQDFSAQHEETTS